MWIIVLSSLFFLNFVITSPRHHHHGPGSGSGSGQGPPDDDIFSRIADQTDVQYNFYNFRPPSMFPEKGGGGGGERGGMEQDRRYRPPSPSPKERRGGRRFQTANHFPDSSSSSSSSSIEHEKRYKNYGKTTKPNHDQPSPWQDNQSKNEPDHHHDELPPGDHYWTNPNRRPRLDTDVDRINRWTPSSSSDRPGSEDEYELTFPPQRSMSSHGRPRQEPMGGSRWDRKGLPMDVSWNQDQHHGPGARDGGMFGHKVTKMWHVMPGGGFVMTEERDKKSKRPRAHHQRPYDEDDDDGYYEDVGVGQQRRTPPPPVTLSVTAGRPPLTTTMTMTTTKKMTKKNHHGDRKMILMTDMGVGTAMEQRLHRRIRKLQVMMSVLQSRRMQSHNNMPPLMNN